VRESFCIVLLGTGCPIPGHPLKCCQQFGDLGFPSIEFFGNQEAMADILGTDFKGDDMASDPELMETGYQVMFQS
jgi:hypothetical protein